MNFNLLIKVLIVFFVVNNSFLFSAQIQDNSSLSLDNRSFEGETGIKDSKSDHIDILRFKNGKFKSKRCKEWGFTAGKYKTTIKDNKVYFEVHTQSEENGTLYWSGVLEGEKLKAKYIWTKKILFWEIKKEYWFNGIEVFQEEK